MGLDRKIKVIHVCDKLGVAGSSIHGVSRLFSWWFPRFDKNKFEVKLIELRSATNATKLLKDVGTDVISLNHNKLDVRTVPDLLKIIKNEKPDILHLHGYGATNFGMIASIIAGIKTIIHEHFVDPALPFYQRPFDYFLGRRAVYAIAVSKTVKNFMIKERYIPEEITNVIYNGAPLNEFKLSSTEAIKKEKKKWCITENCKVIGTIGRLDEQKGNKYLIDAAVEVLKARSSVKFMLVGDGPYEQQLKEQCKSLGIGQNVIFTGFQSNISNIQSIFDIQAFPSLWEGTPLTLFEAMSTRRTIVSTNVDGLGEVLDNGKNALIVPPRDSMAFVKPLLELLDDEQKADILAEEALQESKKYDIQNTVNAFQDVYVQLVSC